LWSWPLALLPRPASSDLQLKGEAQEGTDAHDRGKHSDAGKSGRDRHSTDDVRGDEKLKPKQDRPAQPLTELGVNIRFVTAEMCHRYAGCDDHARHDDGDPHAIDDLTNVADYIVKGHWRLQERRGWVPGLLTPVVVRRGDGLELDGDDLAGGDEIVRRCRVVMPSALEDVEIGLNVVDRVPSDLEGQRPAFFR